MNGKALDNANKALESIEQKVVTCSRCPELRAYCNEIARVKKREYREQTYWGKPVPAFGDPHARVVLVGLAPGAHGSNRTGRMFTGDASGVWLYRALFRAGFANQPEQRDRSDGMRLDDVFITAAIRCAPPGNKPAPQNLVNCAPFLDAELAALINLRVVVGLGAIGTRAAVLAIRRADYVFSDKPEFAHGAELTATRTLDGESIMLLCTYHPSRQNTNTGVLTEPMLDDVFRRARELAGDRPSKFARTAEQQKNITT